MKNSHKKAKRSNFLIAAEMIHLGHTRGEFEKITVGERNMWCSKWCCNVLCMLAACCDSTEQEMFKDYFYPGFNDGGGGWWHRDDCESRVLALLLCAEMLRR